MKTLGLIKSTFRPLVGAVGVTLLGSCGALKALASESAASQLQNQLQGHSFRTVEVKGVINAIKLAVAKNPKGAASILVEALTRKESPQTTGEMVGASIEGLGPQPPPATITILVRLAVELRPDAVVEIVTAAVKRSPTSLAAGIVKTAVAALQNPSPELVAKIVEAASHAKASKKLYRDGKNVVPLGDGKNVVPLGDGKTEVPLEELQTAAMDGLDGSGDPASFMPLAGPGSIPSLPPPPVTPPEVHPPSIPPKPPVRPRTISK